MKQKVVSILTGRAIAARDRLVLDHLHLVDSIAAKLHSTLPPCFDLGDLKGAGMLGLLEAATQFDPIRFPDVPFGAFARRRIKGEMQESIGMYSSSKAKRTTRENRWAEATRPPIAEHRVSTGDEPIRETADRAARADELTENGERRKLVNELIDRLPPREASVIQMHYLDGLQLKTISRSVPGLNVGPARVSQIHSAALVSLRKQAKLRGLKKAA